MRHLLIALSLASTLLANDGKDSVTTVNRFLQALQQGNSEAMRQELANPERSADLTPGLNAFQKNPLSAIRIDRKNTGTSTNKIEGQPVTYVFGEIIHASGKQGFDAQLTKQDNAWRIVGLRFRNSDVAFGTDRYSVQNIPRVRNNVNAMVSTETIINQFMTLAAKGEFERALTQWSSAERAKPNKLDEIKALTQRSPTYFQNFKFVDEGRSNFGFSNQGDDVTEVRVAKGTMVYEDGSTKRFTARMTIENGRPYLTALNLR